MIHHLIEEDHLNIQNLKGDIVHILEVEAETEIVVKKVIKAQEIVVRKVVKDISIVLDHVLQINPKEKLDLHQEKNLEVVQVVHNLM